MTTTAQTTRSSVIFFFRLDCRSDLSSGCLPLSYEPLPFPSPKLTSWCWCWVTTAGVMAPDDEADRFATVSSPFRRATADSSSLSRASRIPRSEGVDGPASRRSAAAGATRGEGNMGGS